MSSELRLLFFGTLFGLILGFFIGLIIGESKNNNQRLKKPLVKH